VEVEVEKASRTSLFAISFIFSSALAGGFQSSYKKVKPKKEKHAPILVIEGRLTKKGLERIKGVIKGFLFQLDSSLSKKQLDSISKIIFRRFKQYYEIEFRGCPLEDKKWSDCVKDANLRVSRYCELFFDIFTSDLVHKNKFKKNK